MMKSLLFNIAYWTFSTLVLVIMRFGGIGFFYEPIEEMVIGEVILISIPTGMVIGLMWWLIEVIETKVLKLKRQFFGREVIIKTVLYSSLFFISAFFGSWISSNSLSLAKDYTISTFSIVNFMFFSLSALILISLKEINKRFGPGILSQHMTGKYYSPMEEERVFMFLDLKSSTSIAEKLSHKLYSQLIQECFAELTVPLLKNRGHVYQYVGDEAVVTWRKEEGLKDANCINFFYDFTRQLESHRDHFISHYGLLPSFKAGLNLGEVMVAEVGELKTEIAYHGDVLNATARIESYCNLYQEPLLIGEGLVSAIQGKSAYEFECIDKVELKGKAGKHCIYNCRKA